MFNPFNWLPFCNKKYYMAIASSQQASWVEVVQASSAKEARKEVLRYETVIYCTRPTLLTPKAARGHICQELLKLSTRRLIRVDMGDPNWISYRTTSESFGPTKYVSIQSVSGNRTILTVSTDREVLHKHTLSIYNVCLAEDLILEHVIPYL